MVLKAYVLSGGPGTGKTSTLNALKQRGYNIVSEATRELATNDSRFKGRDVNSSNDIAYLTSFRDAIFDSQVKSLANASNACLNAPIFFDRGVGDVLAHSEVFRIPISNEQWNLAKKSKYAKIFVLDFLGVYTQDDVRKEPKDLQEKLQANIISMYERLNHNVVKVPFMTVEDRVKFILSNL